MRPTAVPPTFPPEPPRPSVTRPPVVTIVPRTPSPPLTQPPTSQPTPAPPTAAPTVPTSWPLPLEVSQNQINAVYPNGTRKVVILRGVNWDGGEERCIEQLGIFDSAMTLENMAVLQSWRVRVVRLPLNEDCWLGINGVPPQFGGPLYQLAVAKTVSQFLSLGLYVILDLHWSAPGTTPATGPSEMPNRDHSIAFWKSVATAFGSNTRVIFDLFDAPTPSGSWNDTQTWKCWQLGSPSCTSTAYSMAGMQELVTAVRSTNAQNILMVGGVDGANSLSAFLQFIPLDPLNQIAASWHTKEVAGCSSSACWNQFIAPVRARVPVIAGSIAGYACSSRTLRSLIPWLESKAISYVAWTWNTYTCIDSRGPPLISMYNGTCLSDAGCYVRDKLLAAP